MKGTTTYERKLIDVTFEVLEAETGFTKEVIVSRSRTTDVVITRFIGMYILKKLTKMNLKSIGQTFNRDHSSVIHAMDGVRHWMEVPHRYIAETLMLQKVTAEVATIMEREQALMTYSIIR